MGTFLQYLTMILMFLTAIFLIVLILVQRGRGGGLTGALGGMGGQSAFGTKAGDVFTRITVVVAAVWILLCVVSVKLYSSAENQFKQTGENAQQNTQTEDGLQPPPPINDEGGSPEDTSDQ